MKGKHTCRTGGLWLAAIIVIAATGLASCSSPVASGSTITPIYAATANGLSVFDGTTWTNYLASNTVNAVSVEGSGSDAIIYAATSAGLSANLGSIWKTYFTAYAVRTVFIGNDNLYLVAAGQSTGSVTSQLMVLNFATLGTTTQSPWGSTTSVNDVFGDGAAYVATGAGLWVSGSGGGWTSYTTADGLPSNTVNCVFVDSNFNVYVGTANGLALGTPTSGLTPPKSIAWSTITVPGNPAITCLFVDSYGDIYAGTGSGLFVSTDGGSTWTNFTIADGLGSNTINGIFVVGQAIYVATGSGAGTGGGVSVSTDNGSTWKNYTTADGLGSNTVNGIYVTAPLYSY